MAISIRSRVRNSMVGLTVVLCSFFTALTFMLVYIIEDQVFVNQLKIEQLEFERIINSKNQQLMQDWQPANPNIQRIDEDQGLPSSLPSSELVRIKKSPGIHEFFGADTAMFIASLENKNSADFFYLVYDVKDLLVVRATKSTLFSLILALTLIISALAVWLAHRLSKSTLAPVSRLSSALQGSDFDHVVIELAEEFSEDEIGVLARQLGQALERERQAGQREYEFNRGVSHELRSPIQTAQSATELLQLYVSDDGKLAKPVGRLQRSVTEMSEIVEAFLWLASERIVDVNERCSITHLKDILCSLQPSFPDHELIVEDKSIDINIYPLPSKVLSVTLRSLIRNAVIHGEASSITIELFDDRISITNLFSSITHQNNGFGIGMSVVQRMCDRFNCELRSQDLSDTRHCCTMLFL